MSQENLYFKKLNIRFLYFKIAINKLKFYSTNIEIILIIFTTTTTTAIK